MTVCNMNIIQSDSQNGFLRLVLFADVTRDDALVGRFDTSEFPFGKKLCSWYGAF